MEITSDSAHRTMTLGRLLAAVLVPGEVLCLEGELGTGKTVLVQGLARGLGFEGNVPSPTFTIIHPYQSIRLCHIDAYRLSCADELIDAGVEDFLDGEWICAVEWADRVRGAIPAGALTLRMLFAAGDEQRVIKVEESGDSMGWELRLIGLEERLADFES